MGRLSKKNGFTQQKVDFYIFLHHGKWMKMVLREPKVWICPAKDEKIL